MKLTTQERQAIGTVLALVKVACEHHQFDDEHSEKIETGVNAILKILGGGE